MRNFFSWDGPLLRTFDRIGKLIVLSLAWLVCSLPVVTMGYAFTAMYHATVKTVRFDRGYVLPEFFRCLVRTRKQGILCSLLYTGALVLLSLDTYVWYRAGTRQGLSLAFVCGALTVFAALFGIYLFALISRFDYGLKDLFKMAAFLEFKYLHVTFGIGLAVLAGLVCLYLSYWFCLIIPGAVTLIISCMLETILKKIIPDPENGRREWYDEEKKEEQNAFEESI